MNDYLNIIFGELSSFIASNYLSITIGVLSSFVASFIFLLFLSGIKPKIVISEQIAKVKSSKGTTEYTIKVINKTHRPIIIKKARLSLVRIFMIEGGQSREFINIPLKTSELIELEEFNPGDTKWAPYEFRFVTYENIEEMWNAVHLFLQFRFYATDSLSGFSRFFTMNYYIKKNSIIEGEFEFGNSLRIK